MTRRFTFAALAMACVLWLTASRAPAAEDILKLVPDSAWGFLVIHRPDAVDAKLQALGREAQRPVPSPLAMLKQLGMGEGLDDTTAAALLVLPPQGDNRLPTAILLVPVADYGKFRGQFQPASTTDEVTSITMMNQPAWIRHIGSYAALTDASHRAALEKTLRLAKEIPAGLASWKKWLAQSDVAAVILSPGLKQLSARGQESLRRAKASFAHMGEMEGKMAEQLKGVGAVFDIYAKVLQAVEKEVVAYGLGVQLDKQGAVRVVSRTSLVPGGEWARLVGQVPPAKESLLEGLPAGPFVVAGGMGSTEVLSALIKFEFGLLKNMPQWYGLNEKQTEKLVDSMTQLTKRYHALSMSLGVGKGDEPIFSNIIR